MAPVGTVAEKLEQDGILSHWCGALNDSRRVCLRDEKDVIPEDNKDIH